MPSHRVHRLIDRVFLGREYPDVHRWMDAPFKTLGRRHRVLRHSIPEVVAAYWWDPGRLASGILHIYTDKAESELKRRVRRG